MVSDFSLFLSFKIQIMEGLIHTHSGLRWIALILLVVAIFNAITSKRKGEYSKKDKIHDLQKYTFKEYAKFVLNKEEITFILNEIGRLLLLMSEPVSELYVIAALKGVFCK